MSSQLESKVDVELPAAPVSRRRAARWSAG